jgi:hypothetical protein
MTTVLLLLFLVMVSPGVGASLFPDFFETATKALGAMPAKMAKTVQSAQKAADAANKVPPLDPSDEDAGTDYSPPGMPQMPIGCGGESTDPGVSADCQHCYQEAHEELEKLRRYFEQLRKVYVETDEFTKAAIAFGDGMSGSAGVGALEWMHQRQRIMGSFKQFKQAYKSKYEELLGRLDQALHKIGECEARYFGDEDWYNRYGFMFQSFMAMHYAR